MRAVFWSTKHDDGDQPTDYRAICLWKAEFKVSTQKYPNKEKGQKRQ